MRGRSGHVGFDARPQVFEFAPVDLAVIARVLVEERLCLVGGLYRLTRRGVRMQETRRGGYIGEVGTLVWGMKGEARRRLHFYLRRQWRR